jgi:hypothetical protein
MSSGLNGPVGVVFMCMDDRHSPDSVKAELRAKFPELKRLFLLTSAGGNYAETYPNAVITILHAGYELEVVIHAKHKSCDCAASAAGTRVSRPKAYEIVRQLNEEFGVTPEHFVANICTVTSRFTKLQPLQKSLLAPETKSLLEVNQT